jgi:hypothetical protein
VIDGQFRLVCPNLVVNGCKDFGVFPMGKDVKKPAGKFDWVDDFIAEMQRDMKRSSVVFHKEALALEKSLARKAGGEVLSWLSEDGRTIHRTDAENSN